MLELVSGPDCAGYAAGACGSLTLGLVQDGSFFYQPPTDFNGAVTFTYKLIDAAAWSPRRPRSRSPWRR